MWRLEYNTASLLHGLCCAAGGIQSVEGMVTRWANDW